jgi:hypothetical protein
MTLITIENHAERNLKCTTPVGRELEELLKKAQQKQHIAQEMTNSTQILDRTLVLMN